jgi:hypothetical protein
MNNFKVEDRVYHIEYGWGTVKRTNTNWSCLVRFDCCVIGDYSNALLSLTEYTLQGFSQERPIELPNVGELCLVSYDDEHWRCVKFQRYDKTKDNQFIDMNNDGWTFMKRIKIL